MASGTRKSTAASSHSVTEPGPACAAAGIQRVPTMHAMAKKVRSRSPNSRRNPGSARDLAPPFGVGSGTRGFFPQLFADAAQPFLKKLRLAAQPHPDEALQPEMH